MISDDLLERMIDLLENRFFGKYRGTVEDVNDPLMRGRVKVRVPAVLGDVTLWAEVCVPFAGDGVGLMLLPEMGSGAWVEFEGGDPSYPIFCGSFWGNGQLPETPLNASPRMLRTTSGEMKFDDLAQTVTAASDRGGTLTLDMAATMNAGTLSGEVTATGQSTKISKGTKSVEVTDVMVSVNGGNLDVN